MPTATGSGTPSERRSSQYSQSTFPQVVKSSQGEPATDGIQSLNHAVTKLDLGRPQLTPTAAKLRRYIHKVFKQFPKGSYTASVFLGLLKDYTTRRIDEPTLIDRVSTLFLGHPSLIQGLVNIFSSHDQVKTMSNPDKQGGDQGARTPPEANGIVPLKANQSRQGVADKALPTGERSSSSHTPLPVKPSKGELQEQQGNGTQPARAGRPDLAMALRYVDQVKMQFSERPEAYNQFLDILKGFKDQRIDTTGVIKRLTTLFRGDPSLMQGFNIFLPEGYRMPDTLSLEPTPLLGELDIPLKRL